MNKFTSEIWRQGYTCVMPRL